MTTASEVEGFADTALQYPMIFTKLLTVAAVESAVAFCVNRDVKIQQHDSNENVALKSEFVFFQSLSRWFLLTYFVKCTRTLLNLNSKGPCSRSQSEIKFRRCLFTFFIKHKIRYFQVARRSRCRRVVESLSPYCLFLSPVPRSACFARLFFAPPSICPFSLTRSLVPGYHKGNDTEDEYCLTNLLKTFVTRITLAEQRRTLSSTYQQLSYLAGVSVKTNPNHCLII